MPEVVLAAAAAFVTVDTTKSVTVAVTVAMFKVTRRRNTDEIGSNQIQARQSNSNSNGNGNVPDNGPESIGPAAVREDHSGESGDGTRSPAYKSEVSEDPGKVGLEEMAWRRRGRHDAMIRRARSVNGGEDG